VVRVFATGADVLSSKPLVKILNYSCVHRTGNGYSVLFRAGEDKHDEEEEWDPTSVTLLPIQPNFLTATTPT